MRNLSERGGPGKIRAHWEDQVHLVVRRKHQDSPVYEVRPESGEGRVCTLHRNLTLTLTLPCSFLPITDTPVTKTKRHSQKTREQAPAARNSAENNPSEEDDSDEEENVIIMRQTRSSTTQPREQQMEPHQADPVSEGREEVADDKENESGNAEDTETGNDEETVAHHETTADEHTDASDVIHPQDNGTTSGKEVSETVVSEHADAPSNCSGGDEPSAYDSPDQTILSEMEQTSVRENQDTARPTRNRNPPDRLTYVAPGYSINNAQVTQVPVSEYSVPQAYYGQHSGQYCPPQFYNSFCNWMVHK